MLHQDSQSTADNTREPPLSRGVTRGYLSTVERIRDTTPHITHQKQLHRDDHSTIETIRNPQHRLGSTQRIPLHCQLNKTHFPHTSQGATTRDLPHFTHDVDLHMLPLNCKQYKTSTPQLIKCYTDMITLLSTLQEISTISPFTWNYIESNTSQPTQTETYHTSQKLHRDYHSTTNITKKNTHPSTHKELHRDDLPTAKTTKHLPTPPPLTPHP